MALKQTVGNLIDRVGTVFRLPELNVSERMAGNRTTNTGYNSYTQAPSYLAPQPQPYNAAQKANLIAQGNAKQVSSYTAPVSGGGGGSYNPTPTNQINPTDTSMVNNGLQSGNDQIESDYQNALMMADTAESGLRSQAGQATSELNTQGLETSNALESQRKSGEAGVATQEQSAQRTAGTSMQQARDLYRQTQQQNIAQLSALGLSSSSVMEGLAEKLGVETAKRIGGITGSLDEVMTNLGKERARVNEYAKTKTVELQQQLQNQLSSIQNQLMQGVKQISDSRQLAATAKANARAELLSQAQNQIYQIQANANQFAQQMQQWTQAKSATLADAAKSLQAGTINTGNLNAAGQAVSNIGNQGLGNVQQTTPQVPAGYMYKNGKLVIDPNYIANPF